MVDRVEVDVEAGIFTGARLEFDFSGVKRLKAGIRQRSKNLKPWFKAVMIPAFHRMMEEQLASQGAFGGVGSLWAEPYSPKYEAWKVEAVGHTTKEVLRGSMFDSLTRITGESIVDVGSSELIMGTAVADDEGFFYAIVQQKGGTTRKGESSGKRKRTAKEQAASDASKDFIPARPPIPPNIWGPRMRQVNRSAKEYILNGGTTIPVF